MKYVLEKNNKYLFNILPGFNGKKAKAIYTEKTSNALIFLDPIDAKNQAKRFSCEIVTL